MSRTGVHARVPFGLAALAVLGALSASCAVAGPQATVASPASEPIGALRGTLSGDAGNPYDSDLGPLVVMLEPVDGGRRQVRPTQQFRITSTTDRFEPAFRTIAAGDFIVFANEGAVSHRFFSAALGPDLQIPVAPGGSSAPLRIEKTGELRFFCSLHPDETFSLLVTSDVFSAVVEDDGRFYIAPIPRGPYRLSVWSRHAQSPGKMVQVDGPSVTETIQLAPSLMRR
jgi:plastocyanin